MLTSFLQTMSGAFFSFDCHFCALDRHNRRNKRFDIDGDDDYDRVIKSLDRRRRVERGETTLARLRCGARAPHSAATNRLHHEHIAAHDARAHRLRTSPPQRANMDNRKGAKASQADARARVRVLRAVSPRARVWPPLPAVRRRDVCCGQRQRARRLGREKCGQINYLSQLIFVFMCCNFNYFFVTKIWAFLASQKCSIIVADE